MRCKLVGVSSPKRDRPQRRRSIRAFTEPPHSVKRSSAIRVRNKPPRRLAGEHLLHRSDNLRARNLSLYLVAHSGVGLAVLAQIF